MLKLIPRFCTPMWCVPIPSVTPVCLRLPTEPRSRRGVAGRTASVHAPFSKSTACSACPCPSASPVCLVFTLTTILSVPLCANPLGAFGRVVWHPQRPLLCTVAERSSFCVRYACTATRAVRSALNLLSGESREGDDSPNSPCPAFPRTPYHPIPSSPTSSPPLPFLGVLRLTRPYNAPQPHARTKQKTIPPTVGVFNPPHRVNRQPRPIYSK